MLGIKRVPTRPTPPVRAGTMLLLSVLASFLSGIAVVATAQAATFTVTRPDDPVYVWLMNRTSRGSTGSLGAPTNAWTIQ